MNLKKKFLMLFFFVMLLSMPVQAHAARFSVSGASKPTTMTVGSSFRLDGTIKAKKKLKEVRVTIYDSTDTRCLQRYIAYPNSKTYDLSMADNYISFDRLPAGTYYYKVLAIDSKGKKKHIINSRFTVGKTSEIKIDNPVPSADVTLKAGSSYSIGGTISSSYKLKKITAKILNVNKATVYKKTVKVKRNRYNLANSKLDSAMKFDGLSNGTYTFQLIAEDSAGTSTTLIYRTINVVTSSSSNNVSAGSTGSGSGSSGNGSYLNTDSNAGTSARFVKRTARPDSSNPYYYNKNYNIYAKYNSLAPTGKAFSGSYYVKGNCTWYACGRAMEIAATAGGSVSKVQSIFGGDPVGIFNMNASKGVFQYGSTAKVGALAVFSYGSDGSAHIAVVEDIINGVPYVSESGYSVTTQRPSASSIVFKYQSIYNWAEGRTLLGYIYLI
ncbi:MAG: CHAP domain-containing protein [Eubacteriales bacterium]|nr:CHAP domain-containing protein [Eubacteriales bacterium]